MSDVDHFKHRGCHNFIPSPNHIHITTFPLTWDDGENTFKLHELQPYGCHDSVVTIQPPDEEYVYGLLIDTPTQTDELGLILRLNLYTSATVVILYRDIWGGIQRPKCLIRQQYDSIPVLGELHLLEYFNLMHRHPHIMQVPSLNDRWTWQFVSVLTKPSE